MATFGFPDEAEQEGGNFAEGGGVEGDERTDLGRSYNGWEILTNSKRS